MSNKSIMLEMNQETVPLVKRQCTLFELRTREFPDRDRIPSARTLEA